MGNISCLIFPKSHMRAFTQVRQWVRYRGTHTRLPGDRTKYIFLAQSVYIGRRIAKLSKRSAEQKQEFD